VEFIVSNMGGILDCLNAGEMEEFKESTLVATGV
jgi:hypothetical protein